ncbi:predicted protein, partial [Nematostella vectensis]
VVAIVTILGNSIVVAALTHAKFAHKARRLFLISLSAADMLVGAVALPMFVFLIYPSGNALASVSDQRLFSTCYRALDIFTGFASMFTLATISLEHVHAVIWPLEHRALRKRFYFLLVTTSWSLACVLACVFLLTYVGGLLREDIFVYSQTVLSFLSVVIICISYTAVWIKMKSWVRKASQRLVGGQVHERNLSMALAIVTLVFVVTWLPFHTMNIIVNFQESLIRHVSTDVIYFTKLLHYSNSFINPIIYSLKLPEFRAAVKLIFR